MNVPLLRKVKKHILAEPRRLEMNNWAVNVDEEEAPCGTQACIAGWAVILGKGLTNNKKREKYIDRANTHYSMNFWHNTARKLLGLTQDQAYNLFQIHTNQRGQSGAIFMAKKIDELIEENRNQKQ
jgi:hypothetical protein